MARSLPATDALASSAVDIATRAAEINMLLLNKQRQPRTLHIQGDMLPYVCYLLCPVSAALASISRMDSISTSYARCRVRSTRPFQALDLCWRSQESGDL